MPASKRLVFIAFGLEGDNTMTRLHHLLLTIGLVLTLAACTPATPITTPTSPASPASPASAGATGVVVGTATAEVSTVEPDFTTALPSDSLTTVPDEPP